MKAADGLEILELPRADNSFIHPAMIWDQNNVVLIDTGLPGQEKLLEWEAKKAGIPFDKLDTIIITHQDIDHIGSLSALQKEFQAVRVIAHEDDKPYIEFTKPPIKLTPQRLAALKEEIEKMNPEISGDVLSYRTTVNKTVKDQELLEICGGIDVIHTPGHTPGHICLYLRKYKTLVAGDELSVVDGHLTGPNPRFTPDLWKAYESMTKLRELDIEAVICYHGGYYDRGVMRRIDEIIAHEYTCTLPSKTDHC
jgi:glyoxylase-like metal-dependent hydrolase (beta-lactamase superfamily II)